MLPTDTFDDGPMNNAHGFIDSLRRLIATAEVDVDFTYGAVKGKKISGQVRRASAAGKFFVETTQNSATIDQVDRMMDLGQ